MENLDGYDSDEDEKRMHNEINEFDKLQDQKETKEGKWNYSGIFSVNDSFARSDIAEKQKNFTHSTSEIKWKYANFLGGTQEDNIDCKTKGKWSVSKIFGSERGINIRSQIVKPNISFSNSSIEVTIKATLHGTSNLWVFTRYKSADDKIESSRWPVIVINKQECLYQLPCSRVKCMIGTVKNGNKFQYIKRQDICRIANPDNKTKTSSTMDNLAFSDDQVLEDKLYVKFTIKDMAEEGIEVIFYNSKDEVASTMVFYHKPEFDLDGEMLIAGSGNSVYIRDIRIKRKERIQTHDIDPRSYDCCNIF